MSELNDRDQRLVALGAAVSSNCVPCIEYHIPRARQTGCSEAQIKEAVRIADKVRQVPARMVLEAALARLEDNLTGTAETAEAGCGCEKKNPLARTGCRD